MPGQESGDGRTATRFAPRVFQAEMEFEVSFLPRVRLGGNRSRLSARQGFWPAFGAELIRMALWNFGNQVSETGPRDEKLPYG